MKKLMIAAAIVCAAAISQAASLNWATWGYSLDGGTKGDEVWEGNTGAAYLVMVTDAANFAVGNNKGSKDKSNQRGRHNDLDPTDQLCLPVSLFLRVFSGTASFKIIFFVFHIFPVNLI